MRGGGRRVSSVYPRSSSPRPKLQSWQLLLRAWADLLCLEESATDRTRRRAADQQAKMGRGCLRGGKQDGWACCTKRTRILLVLVMRPQMLKCCSCVLYRSLLNVPCAVLIVRLLLPMSVVLRIEGGREPPGPYYLQRIRRH